MIEISDKFVNTIFNSKVTSDMVLNVFINPLVIVLHDLFSDMVLNVCFGTSVMV